VRLCGADKKSHWLLFAGETGQMIQIDGEKAVKELLHCVSTTGNDAH
jgi:hypothetical protein